MFSSDALQKTYESRLARYTCAMRGGTPDRIPICFLFQEAAARFAGYTAQQVACDYNLAFDATREMAVAMDSDAVMLNAIWSNYGVGKAASWRYLYVPGVDVSMRSVLQYGEPADECDQFLRVDEYGEFTDDPTAFLFNKWLARNTWRIRPQGAPVTMEHNVALVAGAMAYANYMNAFGPAAARLKYEAGVVSANAGMIKAPLDILADKFRGYMALAVDTVERPETVRRACEALIPHIVANALGGADPERQVPITIWAHRGCVPFFSQRTFDEIFWPTLRPVFEEIISKGYQILFYGEGNWERHYDALLTLPAGSIIYHLDKGDPALAAAKLKRKFALRGGISYDVLSRGTRADVRAHLKTLFDQMAREGGYIADCTALMLNDIDPANVREASDYILEHGVYSQSSPAKPREVISARAPEGGSRPPNVCIPWERESAGYRALSGDVELVRRSWQAVDAAAYNYAWTSVLW